MQLLCSQYRARKLTGLLAFAFALCLVGCDQATKVEDLSSTQITMPDGTILTAQRMFDKVDLARGMMFRDAFTKDRGMLFVHQRPGLFPYWMYNAKVPLDIIWMDPDHQVVEIAADTPPCPSKKAPECPNFGGNRVARFVLELNAGGAKQYGVTLGSTLKF
ncbi:MAG: DUF192 domain-containing protein [Acidobacteriota bacterium]